MPSTKVESHQVWSSNVQPARVSKESSSERLRAKSTKSTEPSSGRIPASLLFDFVWVLSSSCHPYHANKGTVPTHRWATGKAQTCRKVAVIVPCHSLVFWDFSHSDLFAPFFLWIHFPPFPPPLTSVTYHNGCNRNPPQDVIASLWNNKSGPSGRRNLIQYHQVYQILIKYTPYDEET